MSEASRSSLSGWQLTAFALPAMVSAILQGPVAGIVPSLYASEFGLDLAVIGAVLLAARIFDVVIDPGIGYLSDRTQSRFGRRKPWIAVGTALTLLAMFFVFRPPGHATTTYLLLSLLLFYFGWTLIEIPYGAWSLELSRSNTERTRINAYRSAAIYLGGILFTLAPALVPTAQGRMGFEALGVIAIFLVITTPIATFLALRFVPRGEFLSTEEPKLSELWPSVKANRPFQIFVLVYIFIGLAGGISGGVSFMYIDKYLDVGQRYTMLFLPATIVGPVMLPVWAYILKRFDKYRTTAIAFTVYAAIMPLPWFIQPGPGAFIPMMLYYCALTLFYPLLMISMPSILGDVIDLDELKTGKNRAGQYYAFLTVITKGTAAFGAPLAFLIIGLFGYQPGAAINDATGIFGLRLVHNLLPVLVVAPGLYLLWKFPMTDARHGAIREELSRRQALTDVQPNAVGQL